MTNKFQISNFKFQIKSQSGQVVVILLLLMLVALSIGLAITQQSVTDVTTSTQTEQSSRAFSAAEAGIEKALTGTAQPGDTIDLGNNATATVDSSALLPDSGNPGAAIEYPPIGRETTAQFWFADPGGTGGAAYGSPTFDLYFGNENTTDKPAVEVKILMESGNNFYTKSYYYDSETTSRVFTNNFTPVGGCSSVSLQSGILGDSHKFYCKQTITAQLVIGTAPPVSCLSPTCRLILARVRFLYSNENHKLALAPLNGANFPPQVQIYNATGVSGQSEKQIQAFKVVDVVPPWFDFAVFSINEIRK